MKIKFLFILIILNYKLLYYPVYLQAIAYLSINNYLHGIYYNYKIYFYCVTN